MSQTHYLFAGGGTGGHLFPGLAVASALRERNPDCHIAFLTTDRDLDRQLLSPTDFEQIVQPVRPFTLHPLRLPGFLRAWQASVSAARRIIADRRPRMVLGLGGYAAGPPVVAARALGTRCAILNPDAKPGRANRYLARRADLVILQWDAARAHFPRNIRCETLGCPIRATFANARRDAGCRAFGLDVTRPVLVVTGASQGARTINRAMIRAWPAFARAHPEWQLLHLTGPADEPTVRAAYESAGVAAVVRSFTDEMHLALAAADLVICRAGASTLAELTALGRPAILLPYPFHRDRHQHANGEVLVAAGAAVMIEDVRDPDGNARAIGDALERCAPPGARARMGAAARALGRPLAASHVADRLLSD